jgi:hypothetical protein
MSEKPSKPEYAQQSRLSVVYFRAPVNFGGEEKESVSVPSKADLERGQRASNAVDGVEPDETLPGIVLLKRRHNLHSGKREEVRTFVPWSNVRSISYGE